MLTLLVLIEGKEEEGRTFGREKEEIWGHFSTTQEEEVVILLLAQLPAKWCFNTD